MSIDFPLAILAVVSVAAAVFVVVKSVSHDLTASQRSLHWTIAVLLSLLGLAAGALAWWVWRFRQDCCDF